MSIIKNYVFLVFALCLLIQTSCRVKKDIIPQNNQEKISKDSLLHKLTNPNQPEWFHSKAKVRLSDSYGSQKGNLYLIIKKDSVLWSAVKKLNIEGMRSQVTQDSAIFLNRLDKTYQSFSLARLYNKYGLNPNLNYIQNLITGIVPPIGKDDKIEFEENELYYTVAVNINNVIHHFNFDKYTGWLISGTFEDKYGYSGSWAYDDFRELNSGVYLPFKRVYKLILSDEESIQLDIDFSKITLEESKTIKFKIPSHYARI